MSTFCYNPLKGIDDVISNEPNMKIHVGVAILVVIIQTHTINTKWKKLLSNPISSIEANVIGIGTDATVTNKHGLKTENTSVQV